MAKHSPPDVPFLISWAVLIGAGFWAGMTYLAYPWYLILFVSINLATFFLYGLDKLLAAFQARRIPERTLQFAAFLLGSPGALIAMKVFRHKTRKTSFQFVLALLVLVQAFAVVYLLWMEGFVSLGVK